MTPVTVILPMSFTALPEEILVEILAFLDCQSLLRCSSCCRLLREIYQASTALRCIVEVALDGFKVPDISSSHSDVLSRVHDLRLSWAGANWKTCTHVEIENNCIAYELVAGVFAMSDGRGLSVTWLPSSSKATSGLEVPVLGILVRDFAMDPTQDLIVILEDDHLPLSFTEARHVRLHVRTLSSNEPHPLAKRGIVEFDIPADPAFGNAIFTALVEIAVDTLAFFLNKGAVASKPRLLIWNWKEGTLVYDSESFGEPLSRTVQHFALLGRDSFLLTSTRGSGVLHLYSFNPASPSLSGAALCANLHLPPIQSYCNILQFSIHSGPISSGQPQGTTFSNSPESHLLVMSLLYTIHSNGNPPSASYNLFILKRTLLDYIDRYRREDSSGEISRSTNVEVNWESWGELNSRLITTPSPRPWLRYVHGQRVISNFPDSQSIEVLNFNIASSESVSDKVSHFKRHDQATRGYPRYLFMGDFVTRLPYYSTKVVIGESFYACMIDEERIVGLKMPDSDEIRLHVYSF